MNILDGTVCFYIFECCVVDLIAATIIQTDIRITKQFCIIVFFSDDELFSCFGFPIVAKYQPDLLVIFLEVFLEQRDNVVCKNL